MKDQGVFGAILLVPRCVGGVGLGDCPSKCVLKQKQVPSSHSARAFWLFSGSSPV